MSAHPNCYCLDNSDVEMPTMYDEFDTLLWLARFIRGHTAVEAFIFDHRFIDTQWTVSSDGEARCEILSR